MKNPFKKSAAAEVAEAAPPPIDEVERLTSELEAARAVHSNAVAAEEAAKKRFYENRDELSKQACKAAHEATLDADLEVGAAEHALGVAKAAKAAAVLAANEKRREELVNELSRDAVVAAATPLAQQEADLLVQVATIRTKRLELAVELQRKAGELRRVMSELGLHISNPVLIGQSHVFTTEGAHISIADGPEMVGDLVERALSTMPATDLRRGALEALKPSRMPTRV